jgi:hypothetical protein
MCPQNSASMKTNEAAEALKHEYELLSEIVSHPNVIKVKKTS